MPRPGPARFFTLVGLGANLGDPLASLQSARCALADLPFTRLSASSRLYRSQPVDADGPDFFNAVVALDCGLGPQELMRALLAIEQAHHRERPHRHAPRTLDLDLLWMGGHHHDTPLLQLPHPRMSERAFVLEPLADLVATWPASAQGTVPTLPAPRARQTLADRQGIEPLGPW